VPTATVTTKGQITIPKEVRVELALEPGDRVTFVVNADKSATLRPATVDLLGLFGALKPKVRGVSVEGMNETIRRAAARR